MVYEMMCGRPPFASGNEHETFQRICQARKHLSFPAGFDSDCRSLVRRLLHPNSALRLGNFSDGARAVRDHSFFAAHSVSFDAADRRQLALERVPLDQEDSTDRDGGVGAQDERLLQEAQSELRCVPAK
jgi:serine/threonine protein kinase